MPAAKPERTLTRQFSAPEEEQAGQRKRAKCGCGPAVLGGVAGQLLQFRQTGLQNTKSLLDRFSKGSSHLARSVAQAYKKASITPKEEVADAMGRYLYFYTMKHSLYRGSFKNMM